MRLQRSLAALLVFQVCLVVVSWWPRGGPQEPHPLFAFQAADVTRVRIARKPAEGQPERWLELARDDGHGWRIESASGYPADPARVDALLTKLTGISVRSPIATRATSHDALQVGERQYGRRIELTTAEGGHELWIGAAASNSVNLRLAGSPDVYGVKGLSEWSLADDARSYWNPIYVAAPLAEITALDVQNAQGPLHFRRNESGWSLEGAPPDRSLDTKAVEDFLGSLLEVRLSEPVGTEPLPAQGLDGSLRVTWTLTSSDSSLGGGYVVGAEEGPSVYVKSDTHPFVVRAAKAGFERLRKARLEDFLTPRAAEAPTG